MLKIPTYQKVLNHHPPRKKVHTRNKKLFMNKALSKAIKQRTRLRNFFKKNPTNQNRLTYPKQRNFRFITSEKIERRIFCKPKRKGYH